MSAIRNPATITSVGRRMMTAGGDITYTKAVLYGQDISHLTREQLESLTSIGNPLVTVPLGISDKNDNGNGTTVILEATFQNSNLKADLPYTAVGFFAKRGDEAEKLIAVGVATEGAYLAATSPDGVATDALDIKVAIAIGDSANVTAMIDPAGSVTPATLHNAITDVKSEMKTGLDTKADKVDLEPLAKTADVQAGLDTKANKTAVDSDVKSINDTLATKADKQTVTDDLAKKADKTDVDAQIGTVNKSVSDLSDTVSANKEATDSTLATKANASDVADSLATKADKTEVASDVKSINDALATKANSADVSKDLATKANQSDLDKTNATVATKADQSTVDSDVKTINNTLATKADKSDLDKTNAEVATKADTSTVQNYAKSLQANIDTKADAKTVNDAISKIDFTPYAKTADVNNALATKANTTDLAPFAKSADVNKQVSDATSKEQADIQAIQKALANKREITDSYSRDELDKKFLQLTTDTSGKVSADQVSKLIANKADQDDVDKNIKTVTDLANSKASTADLNSDVAKINQTLAGKADNSTVNSNSQRITTLEGKKAVWSDFGNANDAQSWATQNNSVGIYDKQVFAGNKEFSIVPQWNLLTNSKGPFHPVNGQSGSDQWEEFENTRVSLVKDKVYTVSAQTNGVFSADHEGAVASNKCVLWLCDDKGINQIISSDTTATGTVFTWNNPTGDYCLRVNRYGADSPVKAWCVKIEEGTVATPWIPAISDLANQATLDALTSTVNTKANSSDVTNLVNSNVDKLNKAIATKDDTSDVDAKIKKVTDLANTKANSFDVYSKGVVDSAFNQRDSKITNAQNTANQAIDDYNKRPVINGNNGDDLFAYKTNQLRLYPGNGLNCKNMPPASNKQWYTVEYIFENPNGDGVAIYRSPLPEMWIVGNNGGTFGVWYRIAHSDDISNLQGQITSQNAKLNQKDDTSDVNAKIKTVTDLANTKANSSDVYSKSEVDGKTSGTIITGFDIASATPTKETNSYNHRWLVDQGVLGQFADQINQLKGRRTVDQADFNSLTDTGVYYVTSPKTNNPVGQWGTLVVSNGNGNRLSQLYYPDDNSAPWYRTLKGSTWKSWVQLATASQVSDAKNTATQANNGLASKANSSDVTALQSKVNVNSSLYRMIGDNDTWLKIFGVNNNDTPVLTSLRIQGGTGPLLGNFAAGVGFGGADTKGVLSVAYADHQARITGGNGGSPVWSEDVAWKSDINNVNNQINSTNQTVSALQQTIKTLNDTLSSANATIKTLQDTITGLQTQVSNQANEISYIKANYIEGKRFAKADESQATAWEKENSQRIAFITDN